MHFKQFISNYYELCNMVLYSLLLENVNCDSRKIVTKNTYKKVFLQLEHHIEQLLQL